jgi:hypothetical protein
MDRYRKVCLLALVSLTVSAWLASLGTPSLRATPLPKKDGETLRLQTDGLATPFHLPGERRSQAITSVEIRGTLLADGDGRGTVTLDESPRIFNALGDTIEGRAKGVEPRSVVFRLLQREETGGKRRLYEVAFSDGSFPHCLRLVIGSATGGPHRLLIYAASPAPEKRPSLERILELKGLPEIKEALPAAPLGAAVNLTTLSPTHGESRLQRLAIQGTLSGPARLTLDPNHLMVNAYGDVVGSTLMGFTPHRATLKRVKAEDPSGKGRRLFEIVPDGPALPARYFLVLGPTDSGPHRLLVHEGARLQQVLALHDPDRRYHLALQGELAECSPQEQRGIAAVRRAFGYGFRTKVASGKVVELHVWGGDDAARINPALKHLTNLKTLDFSGPGLSKAGLPDLRHLPLLEVLHFSGGPVSDAGLESIGGAMQLTALTFYCCVGITDEGITHLRGLKNLRTLRLYREDFPGRGRPNRPRITDASLQKLTGLTRLEYLDLMGQQVTDTGLEHLKSLTRLQYLYLSGDGITDKGLEHLRGLTGLRYLHLYQTGVTPAGEAKLKAAVPMLQIGR